LLDWLRIRYRWVLGAAFLLASCYVVWNVFQIWDDPRYKGAGNAATGIIIGAWIFGVVLWFGLKIVRVTLNATTLFRARPCLWLLLSFRLPSSALSLRIFPPRFYPHCSRLKQRSGLRSDNWPRFLVIVTSVNFTAISVIFWITVAAPLFIIYVLTALLFIFEYAFRRIAEYPKGPLFAATAIVAALGLLLRALR
jgi:hypothetical protein